VVPSSHVPLGIKYPTTTVPTTTVQSQTAPRTCRLCHHRELPLESPSDTSRPDTETEDDADGDIDMDRMDLEEEEEDSGCMDLASASTSISPSPEHQPSPHCCHHPHHRHHLPHHRGRQTVRILSDEPINGPQILQVAGLDGGDAHIIINKAGGAGEVRVGVGPVRVGGVGGVEDGIVLWNLMAISLWHSWCYWRRSYSERVWSWEEEA
jgi:hypothetical protein